MSATLDLVPATTHFGRIAGEVFAMMTGIALISTSEPLGPEIFCATLVFRPPVDLTLRLECEPEVAYAMSAELLSLAELPDGFNDDVRDSLGEMVNMLGGNLRNFFPLLESLDATPTVSEGRLPVSVSAPIAALIFASRHGRLRVSLS